MSRQIDLSGSVAVVTGGTRGIGRAISERFAVAGAAVVPTARTASDVQDVADGIAADGGESLAVATDVTDEADVAALFERTAAELGRVDILVNNAGTNPASVKDRPESVDPADFRRTVAVNLDGAFTCLHEAGTYLLDDGGGSVVNIASTSGLVGAKHRQAYVASKHGIVGLTKAVALDWAPTVRVNAVAPGYTSTEMTAAVENDADRHTSVLEDIPAGRFAQTDEIADAALFLVSDMASYVTGECLAANGGLTA